MTCTTIILCHRNIRMVSLTRLRLRQWDILNWVGFQVTALVWFADHHQINRQGRLQTLVWVWRDCAHNVCLHGRKWSRTSLYTCPADMFFNSVFSFALSSTSLCTCTADNLFNSSCIINLKPKKMKTNSYILEQVFVDFTVTFPRDFAIVIKLPQLDFCGGFWREVLADDKEFLPTSHWALGQTPLHDFWMSQWLCWYKR